MAADINNVDSDTVLNEAEELPSESDQDYTELNSIREQITKLQNESTENDIRESQTESDNFQTLFETLETTNDTLISLEQKLELTNHLLVGEFFMLGVLTGIVLFRVFFDRLRA